METAKMETAKKCCNVTSQHGSLVVREALDSLGTDRMSLTCRVSDHVTLRRQALLGCVCFFVYALNLCAQTPKIATGGVVNAASFASGPVSPGSIVSVFGNNFAAATGSAASFPLPTNINGTQVTINGIAAPLFFVSAGQINAQIPWELDGQAQVSLTVTAGGQTSAAVLVNLSPFAPGVFSTNGQGSGQGAILDAQYRLVDSSNPAAPGSAVLIYCTGLGALDSQALSGSPAPSDSLDLTTATPTVVIGGAPAPVLFSGLAPGWVGLYQINAQVPTAVTGGTSTVSVSIGGVPLNVVTMPVVSSAGQGSLQVQITQPPVGAAASVSITSANGFSTVVTANQTVSLPSGTYTIIANPVPVGNTTYGAFPVQQTVDVPADSTSAIQVAYTAVVPQGAVTLDPEGTLSLLVSPDRTTLTFSNSSTVAQSLLPGSILAIGVTPSTPNGLLRKVVSVTQTGSQIVATTTQATLADAFQQATFSFGTALLTPQSAPAVKMLRPGVKLLPRPKNSARVVAVRDSSQSSCTSGLIVPIETSDMPIIADQNGSLTLSGEIDVCVNFEFDWNTSGWPLPKLNSLTATATFGEDVNVNLTGNYQSSFDKQVDVWTYTSPVPYTVVVGTLPLVITPTFTFFFGASGNANGGLSVGVTQTASVTGGLSYSNGQASPVFEQTMNITPDPIAMDASLSAKVYGGVAVSLNVDEVLSPKFSPDVFLQLDVNPLGDPWWTLSAGLEGSASIDVSLFGIATLESFPLPNLFQFSEPIAQADGPFLPAPTLYAVRPSSATAGGPAVNLIIAGANFVPGARAYIGRTALSTSYAGPAGLTATLPASNLTSPGTLAITVANPDGAGAISSPINFIVQPAPSGPAAHFTATAQGQSVRDSGTLSLSLPQGGSVTVSGESTSSPGSAPIATYSWMSNGTPTCSNSSLCTFSFATGTNTIALTVTDSNGRSSTATATVVVSVGSAPGAHFTMTAQQQSANDAGTLNLVVPQNGSVIVSFTASGSTAGTGAITGYQWTSNGTTISTESHFTYSLGAPSNSIALTITNSSGQSASATAQITVTIQAAPTPVISMTAQGQGPAGNNGTLRVSVPQNGSVTVSFDASGSTAGGGTITSYQWASNGTTIGTQSNFTHSFGVSSNTVALTITNSNGQSGSATAYVNVTAQGASGPTASTGSATSITTNSATLGGTVNPNGLDTQFWFLYGTGTSLGGASQTKSYDLGSGTSASGISANIAGLAANTTYYFQLQASNSAGTAAGSINSFNTSGVPGLPTLTGFSISPSTVASGANATLSFTLSAPAPSGGATISLSSNNAAFPVPSIFTVPAGQSSTSFSVQSSTTITSTTTATVTATYNGGSQTATLSLTVAAATPTLSITTTALNPATATVGVGYAAQQAVTATGGTTPYSWSVSGQPSGMGINSSSGAVYGTPTVSGTFSLTVTVRDSSSPQQTASKVLSLTVGH